MMSISRILLPVIPGRWVALGQQGGYKDKEHRKHEGDAEHLNFFEGEGESRKTETNQPAH